MKHIENALLPLPKKMTCQVPFIPCNFLKIHLQSLLSRLDQRHQMSLGNVESSYLLTTAENELGVVVAHSESGKRHRSLQHCDHKVATN